MQQLGESYAATLDDSIFPSRMHPACLTFHVGARIAFGPAPWNSAGGGTKPK